MTQPWFEHVMSPHAPLVVHVMSHCMSDGQFNESPPVDVTRQVGGEVVRSQPPEQRDGHTLGSTTQ
jgi:hypothetical protein